MEAGSPRELTVATGAMELSDQRRRSAYSPVKPCALTPSQISNRQTPFEKQPSASASETFASSDLRHWGPKLPMEICLVIFEKMIEPRFIKFRQSGVAHNVEADVPVILHICRASRKIALQKYTLKVDRYWCGLCPCYSCFRHIRDGHLRGIFVNPELDVFYAYYRCWDTRIARYMSWYPFRNWLDQSFEPTENPIRNLIVECRQSEAWLLAPHLKKFVNLRTLIWMEPFTIDDEKMHLQVEDLQSGLQCEDEPLLRDLRNRALKCRKLESVARIDLSQCKAAVDYSKNKAILKICAVEARFRAKFDNLCTMRTEVSAHPSYAISYPSTSVAHRRVSHHGLPSNAPSNTYPDIPALLSQHFRHDERSIAFFYQGSKAKNDVWESKRASQSATVETIFKNVMSTLQRANEILDFLTGRLKMCESEARDLARYRQIFDKMEWFDENWLLPEKDLDLKRAYKRVMALKKELGDIDVRVYIDFLPLLLPKWWY